MQCSNLVDALWWSAGLQNAKPSVLFVISWMSLVFFVLLVIGVAGFALNVAYDGGDGRAIKPPIVAKRRIGFSTDGDKVPVKGVRL